ncbi:hypothetical protein F4861DRAFT_381294 [Xylaria intraflava]|nr:hypothetical protein F4861DRAFT_381294 [Xylaria intraflava]
MIPEPAEQPSTKGMGDRVTLQVGERKFVTTRATLIGESGYFSALLSDRWTNQNPDGTYFVDSDPEYFVDVLRYLRTGNFPLFYNGAFDYGRYAALLGEAQYFGIQKLEDWIQKQGYLNAVKVQYTTQVDEDFTFEAGDKQVSTRTATADTQRNISHFLRHQKVYLCPRAIPVHRGQPDPCGRQCNNARGGAAVEYEETSTITRVVESTRYIFDPKACLGVHNE